MPNSAPPRTGLLPPRMVSSPEPPITLRSPTLSETSLSSRSPSLITGFSPVPVSPSGMPAVVPVSTHAVRLSTGWVQICPSASCTTMPAVSVMYWASTWKPSFPCSKTP